MELARSCYECSSFISRFNEAGEECDIGLCDRVSDCSAVYSVSKNRASCLFGNPDVRLSEDEVKIRDEECQRKTMGFYQSLRKAKEIVSNWPQWKRNVLGNV